MRQIIFGWITLAVVVSLCLMAQSAMAGQDPSCVPAPLFSGNVVLHMPRRPENLSVQLRPYSRAVGDFDNDGNVDLVFGSSIGSLMYFHGRPDWMEFDPPVVITLPFATPPGGNWHISALAAAHLNNDDALDLIVGDDGNSQPAPQPVQRVHVLLGNGNGTFQDATGAYGPDVIGMLDFEVADFNGDQMLDVMCCYSFNPSVAVMWGDGNGAFPSFTTVALPITGWSDALCLADIDDDGDVDALASPGYILRNAGDTTFAVEDLTALPGGIYRGFSFGEFDVDESPDIVAGHSGGLDESIYVLLNDATGHFPTAVQYPVSTHPNETSTGSAPVATDVDGDGRADVAVMRDHSCSATMAHDQVLVFHNAGDGTFGAPPRLYHSQNVGSGVSRLSLGAADLNHDNASDLIVQDHFGVTLLGNDGNGGFVTAQGRPMGPQISNCGGSNVYATEFRLVTSGDFNNDGLLDLAGIRDQDVFLELTVMLQDAQGRFIDLVSTPLVETGVNIAMALDDLNRDGNLDVVVCSPNTNHVRVALGNGNGTFGPWAVYNLTSPYSVALEDVNDDDFPDLVVGGLTLTIWTNNHDGTFAPPVPVVAQNASIGATGDLNGDGHADLAVFVGSGVRCLLNDGVGGFVMQSVPSSGHELALGDLNADGSPDMVVAQNYSQLQPMSGGVNVLLNVGNGTFQYVGRIDAGKDLVHPVVADLDGDGFGDVITVGGSWNPGAIMINRGHGDGTFGTGIFYGGGSVVVGYLPNPPIIADFDDDGRLDVGSARGCSPDDDSNKRIGFAILHTRMCAAPDPCPADIAPVGKPDGVVNVNDLLLVIGNWGATDANPADINGDNVVDVNDLLAVVGAWGPCP